MPKEKKSKSLAGGKSKAIRSDAVEYGHPSDKNQSDMVAIMSKLLRQQAAPDVDINIFMGDSVDCHYFIAVFDEVVEKKIDDPRGRLTRLIKYTYGQPKEIIKHCIQQPAAVGYENARSLFEEKYGNPHQILAVYCKIKSWEQLTPADGSAYIKFYNFLLKCESATLRQNWNVLDTQELMCLVLSNLPGKTRKK